MDHISSGVSSKTKNHKAHLLEELVEVRKKIVHKDEKISRLAKRLQRLEEVHARQNQQDDLYDLYYAIRVINDLIINIYKIHCCIKFNDWKLFLSVD